MGENLSRRFATMSEEERRRYSLEQERAIEARKTEEAGQELEFEEPRHDPGRTKANLEDKDGTGALVDEEEHARRVRQQAKGRNRERPDRT
jgi:hypothetical protein